MKANILILIIVIISLMLLTSNSIASTIPIVEIILDEDTVYIGVADNWVNETGDTMSGDLNISASLQVTEALNVSDNFFVNNTGGLNLTLYKTCTALETDSSGNLVCGSDAGGAPYGGVADDWVNETGDVMTGDLNISDGNNYVNISRKGSINMSGNITFWGNMSVRTGDIVIWSNGTVETDGRFYSGVADDWVNETGDTMSGDLNITGGSGWVNISARGHINISATGTNEGFAVEGRFSILEGDEFCFFQIGGKSICWTVPTVIPNSYSFEIPPADGDAGDVLSTDGSGAWWWITPDNDVNRTGDWMTGDLNISDGTNFVNLTAGGWINFTGNMSVKTGDIVIWSNGTVEIGTTSTYGGVADDWVNETGDVMTGDLNITNGTGWVNFTAGGHMNLTGNIFVGGSIGIGVDPMHNLDIIGDMLLTHVATAPDEHGLEIKIDANGIGDVKGIDLFYDTGAIGTGQEEEAILITFDTFDSTGGEASGIEIIRTEGIAHVFGMLAGIEISPILQLTGVFVNMTSVNNNGDDDLLEFTSESSDVTMFSSDDDYLIIGHSTHFEEIEFILDTPSSKNILPTFQFSTGVGAWTTFTPTDGTNGLENNGVILWLLEDIPTWATGAGGEYLIMINRTRNNIVTAPIENLVQIADVTEYKWDSLGDLLIRKLNATDAIKVGNTLYVYNNGTINVDANYSVSNGDVVIWNNGTVEVVDSDTIYGGVADDWVNETGDVMTGDLNISASAKVTGNFTVGTDVVIWANGTIESSQFYSGVADNWVNETGDVMTGDLNISASLLIHQALNISDDFFVNKTGGLLLNLYQSCGALETDSSGNLVCGSDAGQPYGDPWVNETGDIMSGDLNISDGNNYVNISRKGSINMSGNITFWGNMSVRTGDIVIWSNGTVETVDSDTIYGGVADDWVNETGDAMTGDLNMTAAFNTTESVYIGGNLSMETGDVIIWANGTIDSSQFYSGVADNWVNETGDAMSGDLNITSALNITQDFYMGGDMKTETGDVVIWANGTLEIGSYYSGNITGAANKTEWVGTPSTWWGKVLADIVRGITAFFDTLHIGNTLHVYNNGTINVDANYSVSNGDVVIWNNGTVEVVDSDTIYGGVADDWVNETGDVMSGDLNITDGTDYVNLTASGDISFTGNLTIDSNSVLIRSIIHMGGTGRGNNVNFTIEGQETTPDIGFVTVRSGSITAASVAATIVGLGGDDECFAQVYVDGVKSIRVVFESESGVSSNFTLADIGVWPFMANQTIHMGYLFPGGATNCPAQMDNAAAMIEISYY